MVFTSVSAINDRAVLLLQQGKNRQAVVLMVQAYARFCKILGAESFGVGSATLETGSLARRSASPRRRRSQNIACDSSLQESLTNVETKMEDEEEEEKVEGESCHADTKAKEVVFSCAFLIPSFRAGEDMDRHYSVSAGILLYNSALGLHRESNATGNTRLLAKALALYRKAYAVVKAEASDSSDPLVGLLLALLTNIAHIQQAFGQIDDVDDTKRIYLRLFEVARDATELSHEDSAFFSYIAMVFTAQRMTAAPRLSRIFLMYTEYSLGERMLV